MDQFLITSCFYTLLQTILTLSTSQWTRVRCLGEAGHDAGTDERTVYAAIIITHHHNENAPSTYPLKVTTPMAKVNEIWQKQR